MNKFLLYFAVVMLLVAFDMSVFVKISTLIATAAVVTCWEMGLFQYLPLIGWLFERNPK